MELGQYQLQIFTSLVVILIAALVALICDFLKGNNEQLRELTIELKVRSDEERRLVRLLTAPEARTERREEPLASAPPQPQPPAPVPTAQPAAVVATKNWSAVLSRGAEVAKSTPKPSTARPQALEPRPDRRFPTGFHDNGVLERLAQIRQQVSGLVVSIGVNPTRTIDAVRKLVQSLIGPDDFACQSSDDEFLLIYPGEFGASAQRRLSEIAQQLWNFQLGTMGTFSIVFSWGGVEVRDESIEEAIASANERMQETRRGRKLLMMRPPHSALKQAV